MTDKEKREYGEKIAEAVRAACLECFQNKEAPAALAIRRLHLPAVVYGAIRAFPASRLHD